MTNTRLATFALLLLASAARDVRADDTADEHIARAKDAHAQGDFTHARAELLAAYQLDPRPALLFALGQVELNLGHYKEAIDYYERFKATNPPTEQIELAEQAIGAARIQLERPPPKPEVQTPPATPPQIKPEPPRPPPHREWDTADTVIASAGGAAAVAGVILIVEAVDLPLEMNATLHTYEARIGDAYLLRDIGVSCAAAGVLAFGGAILRWHYHLVETVNVETLHGGVAFQIGGRL